MTSEWQRGEPEADSFAESAPNRGNFQSVDEAVLGKNLLGDPTGECFPQGDVMSPGDQWGHWNCSGGAGATVSRLTGQANTYLESNEADAAMCFRIAYGTSVTRLFQTLLSTSSFLDRWQSKQFSISAAVKSSSAGQARLFVQSDAALDDLTDYSDYHTGSGDWEWLTATITSDAAADRLIFGVENKSSGNVDVDACVMLIGPIPSQVFVPAEIAVGPIPFSAPGDLSITGGPAANGTNLDRHPFWRPAVVRDVQLHVVTAPTGQAIIVDVNHDGTTMFSTKPQIAAGAFAGSAQPDGTYRYRCFDGRSGSSMTDALLSFDIDQIGSGTVGAWLKAAIRVLQWRRPLEWALGHDEVG